MEYVESPQNFLDSIISQIFGGATYVSMSSPKNFRNYSVTDPVNQPPHHRNNFSKQSLVRLFSNFAIKFEVIGVEKIPLPRIFLWLFNQKEWRLGSKAVYNTIMQRRRNSNFSFESFMVSAVKGGEVE